VVKPDQFDSARPSPRPASNTCCVPGEHGDLDFVPRPRIWICLGKRLHTAKDGLVLTFNQKYERFVGPGNVPNSGQRGRGSVLNLSRRSDRRCAQRSTPRIMRKIEGAVTFHTARLFAADDHRGGHGLAPAMSSCE
jgi:hypothetical protein